MIRMGSLGSGRLSISAHVASLCHRGSVRVHGVVTRHVGHKGVSLTLCVRSDNGRSSDHVGARVMGSCITRVRAAYGTTGRPIPSGVVRVTLQVPSSLGARTTILRTRE